MPNRCAISFKNKRRESKSKGTQTIANQIEEKGSQALKFEKKHDETADKTESENNDLGKETVNETKTTKDLDTQTTKDHSSAEFISGFSAMDECLRRLKAEIPDLYQPYIAGDTDAEESLGPVTDWEDSWDGSDDPELLYE